eukprot:174076-Amphidinium_carterae.1
MEAKCRRAAAEQAAIEQEVQDAQNASRDITATALSQLGDDTSKPSADPDGAETVIECNSPKHMDEVDDLETDLPALQTHAAQLAALQAADGASAGSAEFPISAATRAALQRSAKLKISPRPLHAPMEAVPEEQAQPSET